MHMFWVRKHLQHWSLWILSTWLKGSIEWSTVPLRPYARRVWCVTQTFQKLTCPIPLNGSAGVSRHRKISLFGRYFRISKCVMRYVSQNLHVRWAPLRVTRAYGRNGTVWLKESVNSSYHCWRFCLCLTYTAIPAYIVVSFWLSPEMKAWELRREKYHFNFLEDRYLLQCWRNQWYCTADSEYVVWNVA